MLDKIMYVLVHSKLSKSERIPQCGHAVAEFMSSYGQDPDVQDWVHNHKTMVCLHTTQEEMQHLMDEFNCDDYKSWSDSDLTHRFTIASVAFRPMTRDNGIDYFSHLKLS